MTTPHNQPGPVNLRNFYFNVDTENAVFAGETHQAIYIGIHADSLTEGKQAVALKMLDKAIGLVGEQVPGISISHGPSEYHRVITTASGEALTHDQQKRVLDIAYRSINASVERAKQYWQPSKAFQDPAAGDTQTCGDGETVTHMPRR